MQYFSSFFYTQPRVMLVQPQELLPPTSIQIEKEFFPINSIASPSNLTRKVAKLENNYVNDRISLVAATELAIDPDPLSQLLAIEEKLIDLNKELENLFGQFQSLFDIDSSFNLERCKEAIGVAEKKYKNYVLHCNNMQEEIFTVKTRKTNHLETWNNIQFQLLKASKKINWLNDFLELPLIIEDFAQKTNQLFLEVQSLPSDYYQIISREQCDQLKQEVEEITKLKDELASKGTRDKILRLVFDPLSSKVLQRQFKPTFKKYDSFDKGKLSQARAELKEEEFGFSKLLYDQCLEKWNNGLTQILKINLFLDQCNFFYYQTCCIKKLFEEVEALNKAARSSLEEHCERFKSSTPHMEKILDRLKILDQKLIEILLRKEDSLKEYDSFLAKQHDKNKIDIQVGKFLKDFVFNENSTIEQVSASIRREIEQHNLFLETQINEINEIKTKLSELLPNTGRQLDKFIDAYGNCGYPFRSILTGKTSAQSENYKQLCSQNNPVIKPNRIDIFLGRAK